MAKKTTRVRFVVQRNQVLAAMQEPFGTPPIFYLGEGELPPQYVQIVPGTRKGEYEAVLESGSAKSSPSQG